MLSGARADTAAETVERCLARALELGGGVIRDDVAVLVAHRLDRRENFVNRIFDTGTMTTPGVLPETQPRCCFTEED